MATKVTQTVQTEAGTSIEVRCIESINCLLLMREQIDAISDNPFLKSAWMYPWIETMCSDSCKLHFLVVMREQQVVGYAPLVLRKSFSRGRHLTFVGSGKTCADYMTFPTLPGFEEEVNTAIAGWLNENDSHWDRMELDGVTVDNSSTSNFCDSMTALGCEVHPIETLSSYRLELPETWDDFLATLSKNSRKKFRRQSRAIEGNSTLHQATDSKSLLQGLEILESLHTSRWNSLGEEGCFAHPGFREFLTAMAKEKLEQGTLSLIWLTYEGQPIAADIGYRSEEGLYTYQGGISTEHLHLEPGRAIIKCQMELAMARGLKFIDFLRGDEPYKARFNTNEIKNLRYEIVGGNTRARVVHSILHIGRLVKSIGN